MSEGDGMFPVKRCPECDIPEPFGQGQVWLDNGDIVQRQSKADRLAFIDTEGLDPLFATIGEIIGTPIENMVINIAARTNKHFLYRLIPREIRDKVRSRRLEILPLIEYITTLAQTYGLARYELLNYRYEGDEEDYSRHRIIDPVSLPLTVGAYAGAVSSLAGGEIGVYYEEISSGVYEYTAHWTEYPAILKEKIQARPYRHRDGDIAWERCGTCGCPQALSTFEWHPEDGVIRHRRTGRRVAMLGPAQLDPIFEALEGELGEELPRVVVEAQRRLARWGMQPFDFLAGEEELRGELALRGLGNLRELRMGERGARLRLENACIPLLVTGLAQGGFEAGFGVSSEVEWEFSQEGDLTLEITPA